MRFRRSCSASHFFIAVIFFSLIIAAEIQSSCKTQADTSENISSPVLASSPPTPLPVQQATTPAHPPVEKGNFRKPELIELIKFDPTLRLDIRYATANNFVGRPLYTEARAFLQKPAAEALKRANEKLHRQGYGILIFDGYRPWAITKLFWDTTPASLHNFVANPAKGSKHNRGCAVDLSLYDLKSGQEIEMPSKYDEMTERAYPTYKGGTPEQRKIRDLLRKTMEAEGFRINEYEWWHFDYKDWKKYSILNLSFSDLNN